ncbi:serine/threonine protein kinase [Sorangium sp. So ce131]|uniref:serine/threonine protein kinase n=1 Tax=Sorangium sp. So ce131 TaxID=3133282 RepID=UPI003F6227CC
MVDGAGLGYRIVERLEDRGYADVYAAVDREGRGALLYVREGVPDGFLERLGRLRAVSGRMEEVPAVLGGGLGDGFCWLAVARCQGASLRVLLEEEPRRLAPPWAITQVAEVAEVLRVAHTSGVFHGDLCPEAVVLLGDGSFQLAGLGVAQLFGLDAAGAAKAAAYRAPEQLAAPAALDERTDVYALGLLLYELLGLRQPFAERAPEELVRCVLHNTPLPIETFVPLPPLVAGVVRRATERHPDARYRDMEELIAALHAALESWCRWRGEQDPGEVLEARRERPAPQGRGLASLAARPAPRSLGPVLRGARPALRGVRLGSRGAWLRRVPAPSGPALSGPAPSGPPTLPSGAEGLPPAVPLRPAGQRAPSPLDEAEPPRGAPLQATPEPEPAPAPPARVGGSTSPRRGPLRWALALAGVLVLAAAVIVAWRQQASLLAPRVPAVARLPRPVVLVPRPADAPPAHKPPLESERPPGRKPAWAVERTGKPGRTIRAPEAASPPAAAPSLPPAAPPSSPPAAPPSSPPAAPPSSPPVIPAPPLTEDGPLPPCGADWYSCGHPWPSARSDTFR